jgi:hypothetical protein
LLFLGSRFCARGGNRSLSWIFCFASLAKYLTPLTSTRALGLSSGFARPRFDSHSNTKILKPKCIHIWVKVFYVPEVGIEPYRFSTPIGYIFSQAQNIAQSGFDSHYQNKKLGTRPSFLFRCPRWESNPHPLRDTILSRARIPVPPLGHLSTRANEKYLFFKNNI